MPYKYKRRGKTAWRGQVRAGGKLYQRELPTKAEAAKWEATFDPLAASPTPTPLTSLLEWATAYLESCIRFQSKTTNDKANVFRRLFKAVSPDASAAGFTRRDALTYLQGQFQARSGYAANKDRKNLGAAWKWATDYLDGFPAANPFLAVRKFPEERQARYVPPERDFWTVVDMAQGQDRIMLLTMLYLAARKGEVFRLTWEDVDLGGRKVRLMTRKRQDGSMDASWVPMVDDLFDVLLAHRQGASSPWVFAQSVGRHRGNPYTENRDFPQSLCRAAGVRPFGCHAIRHLTASILARANTPMVAIQEVLRHKKLATTERYVRGMESVRPYLQILQKRTKSGPKTEAPKVAASGAS